MIFDFDKDFRGLLGIDFLSTLGCKIDIKNLLLKSDSFEIPMHTDIKTELPLKPRHEQYVKLLCNYIEGDYILEEYSNQHISIPTSIVSVKNGSFITSVINNTENQIKIKKSCKLKLIPLEQDIDSQHNIYYTYDRNTSHIQKNNLNRLRTQHMNSDEKRQIEKLCFNYRDIFYCEEIPLTFTHDIKHKLRLTDENPIYVRNYRQAPQQRMEIDNQVKTLLKQNIIRESNSPWSCPVHIVPKKADASGKVKWRLVIDYRRLNDKTIEDKYPLPNINDILDRLGRAQYFTTLDLASGYHQVEMHSSDIEKTAFSTERGHYEFLRMPFGLKNAPSTFQRLMDSVLRGISNAMTYLDDVIIFSTSLQEHINTCQEVFERFRAHNLKIQLDKSEFLQKTVKFLGHTLTDEGIKPNNDKIEAVKKFPLPKTQKEIKSFLGLVGYYRKFIQDFAKLTKPMTSCLKKNAKVIHNKEFLECFDKCKQLLVNAPILQYPDFEKPFILTTDASDVAIGSVLSQGTVGSDKPVAFASRTLSVTECKYSTIEKELLSIVWATKYFRPYLYGRKFIIYTDHRPLTWIMSLKDPNSKLTRWRLKLEEYDYTIVYKKGKYNTNADALSRVVIHTQDTEIQESATHNVELSTTSVEPQPSTSFVDPQTSTSQDENVDVSSLIEIPIVSNVDSPNKNNLPQTTDAIDRQLKQFYIRQSPGSEYRVEDRSKGRTIIKDVFIPINDTQNQIIKFLLEHTIADRVFHCYFYQEELYEVFDKVYKTIFNDRGPKLIRCLSRVTRVENRNEQVDLIKKYHEGKTLHRGIQETYKQIHRNYYWPNMLLSVQKYINQCEKCLKSKYERNPLKLPLALTHTPHKPMEHLFMDLYSTGGVTFLTVIDNFTKYAQAIPLQAATSIHIAEALLQLFSILGIPLKITTDSDTKFDNEVIAEICALHNINIHFTTPYNPNSNSPIERLHSTLAEMIRIQRITDKHEPSSLMKYAIIAYNNTIHSSTSFTPFELLLGHTSSRNPLEMHFPQEFYQEYVNKHKQIMENVHKLVNIKLTTDKENVIQKANQNKEIAKFKVNDIVYKQVAKTARSNKLEPRYLGPYTIVRIHPEQIAEIVGKHVNAKTIRVHFRMLRRPGTCTESPSSLEPSGSPEPSPASNP